MKNYQAEGKTMDITAGANIVAGEAVAVGGMVVVAMAAIANGAVGVAATCGVFTLTKASSGAIAQGAVVYLTGAGVITTSASGNTVAGVAHLAAADGATAIDVLLR